MTTTEYELGHSGPWPQAAGRPQDRARLRLVLAVAGLAALIAWGIWNEGWAERQSVGPTSTDQVAVDRAGTARYDGRGKWTGYLPR